MKNKSLEVLGVIINMLSFNHCWYRVVGGFGVDGQVGHLARSHADVDVIILEEELDRVKKILRKQGFVFSVMKYQVVLKINNVTVGLGRIARDRQRQNYWLVTLPELKWPGRLLKGEEVILEGIKYIVPSKEFLLSTKIGGDKRPKGLHDCRLLEQIGAKIEIAQRYRFPFGEHRGQKKG